MVKDEDTTPNFIALNRYRNVNKKEIEEAKSFLSGKLDKNKVASWVKRYADHLQVKKGKLMLDDKIVVGNDERDDLMRKLVYDKDSDIAPSRDAGYYKVKKRYVNISRRNWMEFLKKQRVIRMTDNAPPEAKTGGKKINKKGELECDLFYVANADLKKNMKVKATDIEDPKNNLYVLNVVDRLTSYCKLYYCDSDRSAKNVRKKIRQAVKDFEKILGIDRKEMIIYHDAGGEFSDKGFEGIGVKHEIISVGAKVEQKNSHVQRVFHRLKNAERLSSIEDGLKQTEKIVNGSYNRILKMSAAEAVEKYSDPEEMKKIIQKYNSQRAKWDTDRRKPLEVGDFVRRVVKSTKEGSTFYKAYRGKTYTRQGFPVNEANKHMYKPKQATKEAYRVEGKRGKNPVRYLVDGKWLTRDRLSEPMPFKLDKNGKKVLNYPDLRSEVLLRERQKEYESSEEEEEEAELESMFAEEEKEAEVKRKPKKAKKQPPKPKPKKKEKSPSAILEREVVVKMEDWEENRPPHMQVKDFKKAIQMTKSFMKDVKAGKDNQKLRKTARQLLEYWTYMKEKGPKSFRRDFSKHFKNVRSNTRKLFNS